MANITVTNFLTAATVTLYYALDRGVQTFISPNLTYALDANGTVPQTNNAMLRDLDKIDAACPVWSNGQLTYPTGFNATTANCLPSAGITIESPVGEQLYMGCYGANLQERIADCTTKARAYMVDDSTATHSGNVTLFRRDGALIRRDDDHLGAVIGGALGAGLPAIGGAIFAGWKVYSSKAKVDMQNGGGLPPPAPPPSIEHENGGMGNGNSGMGSVKSDQLYTVKEPTEIMTKIARENTLNWVMKTNPDNSIDMREGATPEFLRFRASMESIAVYAGEVARGRTNQDALAISREFAGVRLEQAGIAEGPVVARAIGPSTHELALAESIRDPRFSDKIVVKAYDASTAGKTPFELEIAKMPKPPMQSMRKANPWPKAPRPLHIPEEIAAAIPPEVAKSVKAEWKPVNIFDPAEKERRRAIRKQMPESARNERITANNKQAVELEANNKATSAEIAAAEARQKELEGASAQAQKDKAAAPDPASAEAAAERVNTLEFDIVMEQSTQQAGHLKAADNLEKEVVLKQENMDLEMDTMMDRVENGPGGFHKDWTEMPSDTELQSPENAVLKEALERPQAAATEVIVVHEWVEFHRGSAEQMYTDRLARAGLPPPSSGFVPIGESTAGSEQHEEQHPDDPHNSALDEIPKPGEFRNPQENSHVKTAQDIAKEAMLKQAEFVKKRPNSKFIDPLKNRPVQPKPNQIADDSPSKYYADHNPLTESQQRAVDRATRVDFTVYSDDWAKQSLSDDFWRTWDKDFSFDLAAKYWEEKAEVERKSYKPNQQKKLEYIKKATNLRDMKTRYEAFKAKQPSGSRNGGTAAGSGTPFGGDAAHPEQEESTGVKEETRPADMNWNDEWKKAGTDLPAPKPWEIPGGSGSGSSGLPGVPGTEEFKPGEIEFIPEHPIPIEPPVFFHGEKMKRARRGQGFGPRRG